MTSQDFRSQYPEFQHRLLVRKTWDSEHPVAVEIRQWLEKTFGEKGGRWRRQPMASLNYLVYWFKDERDLAWAQLRWS